MPVSTAVHISFCLELILPPQPKSVLDVGCGFGLWGFLCREYLDVFAGRVRPEDWETRIDAIEMFEPYIQAHQRALYSSIQIADIREAAASLDSYDLIIAGDVIEHLDKADGERVLDTLYQKASNALLVNIPIGAGWDHPETHGNPGELHRSQWYPEDFLAYAARGRLFDLPCGEYGVYYCTKDTPDDVRAQGHLDTALFYEDRKDIGAAIRHMRRALALDFRCGGGDGVLFLSDLLLRSHEANEAISLLEESVQRDPAFHVGHLMLAKVYIALVQKAQAVKRIGVLLGLDGVKRDVREDAEALKRQLDP